MRRATLALLLLANCVEKCDTPKRAGCNTTMTMVCVPVISGRIITMVCTPQEHTLCDVNSCASEK